MKCIPYHIHFPSQLYTTCNNVTRLVKTPNQNGCIYDTRIWLRYRNFSWQKNHVYNIGKTTWVNFNNLGSLWWPVFQKRSMPVLLFKIPHLSDLLHLQFWDVFCIKVGSFWYQSLSINSICYLILLMKQSCMQC